MYYCDDKEKKFLKYHLFGNYRWDAKKAACIQVAIFKPLRFPSAMVVFESMLELDAHLESVIKKNSHSPYMEASSSPRADRDFTFQHKFKTAV